MRRTSIALLIIGMAVCQPSTIDSAVITNVNTSLKPNNRNTIVYYNSSQLSSNNGVNGSSNTNAAFTGFVDNNNGLVRVSYITRNGVRIPIGYRADGTPTFNVPRNTVINGQPVMFNQPTDNQPIFIDSTPAAGNTGSTTTNPTTPVVVTPPVITVPVVVTPPVVTVPTVNTNANLQGVVELNADVIARLIALQQLAVNNGPNAVNAIANQTTQSATDLSALLAAYGNVDWASLFIGLRANANNVQEYYDLNTNNALTPIEVLTRISSGFNGNVNQNNGATNVNTNNQNTGAVNTNNQNTGTTNTNVNNQNTGTVNTNTNNQNTGAVDANNQNNNNVNTNNQNTTADPNNTGVTSNQANAPTGDTTVIINPADNQNANGNVNNTQTTTAN